MITRPTVFVFGAGASIPYGFPSGKELVEQICAATAGTSYTGPVPLSGIDTGYIHDRLVSTFGEEKTLEFGTALFHSQRLSIDSFLEHRPEFIEIGKLSIAFFILRNEIFNNLLDFGVRDKGCYQFLFNKMNTSWHEFRNNEVSFITFNYDRSLEHSFFTSLKNTYNKSDEECANQLSNIPIVHLHGKLGDLPWQSKDGIPYGASFDKNRDDPLYISTIAKSAASQIKIITEDQSDSEDFQLGYKLLSNAKQVYFLGFGFHPTNMERLGIQKLSFTPTTLQRGLNGKPTSILSPLQGTGFHLENAEIYSIQEKWGVSIPDNNSDSLLFLRKYAELS